MCFSLSLSALPLLLLSALAISTQAYYSGPAQGEITAFVTFGDSYTDNVSALPTLPDQVEIAVSSNTTNRARRATTGQPGQHTHRATRT